MLRLSIILPVLGHPVQMEDSLVSVLENRPRDCEILVVHNAPYDDPYDLKNEVCFIEASRDANWVDTLNLGIAVSRAPIIHFVTCGATVREGWAEAALAVMADEGVAVVVPWILDADRPQRLLAAGARWQAWGRLRRLSPRPIEPLPEMSEALVDPDLPVGFYRKSALDLVGRFSAKVGQRLASVDLVLTLQQLGFRSVVEPRCQMVGRRGISAIREGAFCNGWTDERMFWRWRPLARGFGTIAAHGLLVAAQAAATIVRPTNLLRLTGRIFGSLPLPPHGRHWRGLDALREEKARRATEPQTVIEPPHFHRLKGRTPTRRVRSA